MLDMGNPQKSAKRQHQDAFRTQTTVSQMTPIDARSLNNNIMEAKTDAQAYNATASSPPSKTSFVPSYHQEPNATGIPTPPQSPQYRPIQRPDSAPRNGSYTHSPSPQSFGKAGFIVTLNSPRPSTASAYHPMPTYRGPEMTKTGSFSMLQPSVFTHQIADNPLSQFSRPRQARESFFSVRRDHKQHQLNSHSTTCSDRSNSLLSIDLSLDQPPAVSRLVNSPASFPQQEPAVTVPVPDEESSWRVRKSSARAKTTATEKPGPSGTRSKFSWLWKKNSSKIGSAREDDIHGNTNTGESASLAKDLQNGPGPATYKSVQVGNTPDNQYLLKGNLPSNTPNLFDHPQTELENTPAEPAGQCTAHPSMTDAIEQNVQEEDGNHDDKQGESGKKQLHESFMDESIPMYSRCSCCGKIKTPDIEPSLSSEIENKNTTSNFSNLMQNVDDIGVQTKRVSSPDAQAQTLTNLVAPTNGNITRVEIHPATKETHQPQQGFIGPANDLGDIVASRKKSVTPRPGSQRKHSRSILKFPSLHFKEKAIKQDTDINQSVFTGANVPQTEAQDSQPPIPTSFGSIYPTSTTARSSTDEVNSEDQRSTLDRGTDIPHTSEEHVGQMIAAMDRLNMAFDQQIYASSIQPYGNTICVPSQKHHENIIHHLSRTSEISLNKSQERSDMQLEISTSIDEPLLPNPSRPNSIKSFSTSKAVSFDPSIVESHRASGKLLPRSAKRNSQASCTRGNRSSTISGSSQGFVTKPKGTAQYMNLSNGIGHHKHSASSASSINTETQILKSRDMSNDDSISTKSAGTSKYNSSYVPVANNTLASSPLRHENMQTKTTRSPGPQAGGSSRASGFGLNQPAQGSGRRRSNLVESVLAATNRDHISNDYPKSIGE